MLECGVQVGGFGGQLGLFLVDSVTLVPEQSCRPLGPLLPLQRQAVHLLALIGLGLPY